MNNELNQVLELAPKIDKPFEYDNGRFETKSDGLYYIKDDKPMVKVSSQIEVKAMTRNAKSHDWGRLLVWHDKDNKRHEWAMPMEMLQGDGSELRRELANAGLHIECKRNARDLLIAYIQSFPVEAFARCVDRLGWHGSVYVTASESVGEKSEMVVFQNSHALEPAFMESGTMEDWRDTVAKLAIGNSRLVFALSVAFAGALADVVGEDSGGFHLRGGSSSGKSTALKAAASVWGNPSNYTRLWKATTNGLEGLAALHNDGLLILDELGQIDPREAGEGAYLLANGQGKARASRTGTARQSARWRLLFLSAGEVSLTSHMAQAGKKSNTGQEIRLADIEADAGAGMGAFEALNGHPTPAALSVALKEAANCYHGAVGMAWLRLIVDNRSTLVNRIEDGIRQFVDEVAPKDAAGQVLRVARRFGLVAVAGELATEWALTGWQKGEAYGSVQRCFTAWLESFGGSGNRESRGILSQVRAFFEAHGASRFEDSKATSDQRIPNRAGFFRHTGDGMEYMVLPEAFRTEVCKGFDVKVATKVLTDAGWLICGEGGRPTQKPRIPAISTRSGTRCYVFSPVMWGDE